MRFSPAIYCPAANDTLHELELTLDGIVSAEKARISIERLVDQLVEDFDGRLEELECDLRNETGEKEAALNLQNEAEVRAATFDKRVEEIKAEQEAEITRLNDVLDTLEDANLQLIANTDAKTAQIRKLEESNLQLHQKCVRLARELREMAEKYEGGSNG